jgi:hypothetical protein
MRCKILLQPAPREDETNGGDTYKLSVLLHEAQKVNELKGGYLHT